MATSRRNEPPEFRAHCQRVAIFALLAVCTPFAFGIPEALGTKVAAISEYTRPLDNDGPFYFWRGADMRPLNPPADGTSALRGYDGMVVEQVEPHSPAARAGLRPGDVVSALDGMPVNSARNLAFAVADHCCGPTVTLRVWRHHHQRSIVLPPSG